MIEVVPKASPALENVMKNMETWKNYQETVVDKIVYTKRSKRSLVTNMTPAITKQDSFVSSEISNVPVKDHTVKSIVSVKVTTLNQIVPTSNL